MYKILEDKQSVLITPSMHTAARLRPTRFNKLEVSFEIFETESRKKLFLDVKDMLLAKITIKSPVAIRGPVGSGKSYSILYVIHKLKEDEELKNNIFIVYFNDCGLLSIDEFILEMIRAFSPILDEKTIKKYARLMFKMNDVACEVFKTLIKKKTQSYLRFCW